MEKESYRLMQALITGVQFFLMKVKVEQYVDIKVENSEKLNSTTIPHLKIFLLSKKLLKMFNFI